MIFTAQQDEQGLWSIDGRILSSTWQVIDHVQMICEPTDVLQLVFFDNEIEKLYPLTGRAA